MYVCMYVCIILFIYIYVLFRYYIYNIIYIYIYYNIYNNIIIYIYTYIPPIVTTKLRLPSLSRVAMFSRRFVKMVAPTTTYLATLKLGFNRMVVGFIQNCSLRNKASDWMLWYSSSTTSTITIIPGNNTNTNTNTTTTTTWNAKKWRDGSWVSTLRNCHVWISCECQIPGRWWQVSQKGRSML